MALFLLPRILCPRQDVLGHPLGPALSHPRGGSSFTPSLPCAYLAHSHRWSLVATAFPPLEFPTFRLLIPFGFEGRGEALGGWASRLGVTGRRWIMCLFFNSMKKPTSKIPFLFFLDLGIQLLPLTELGASASCSVHPGPGVTGKPHRHPILPLHAR